jgi:hypothetical protein
MLDMTIASYRSGATNIDLPESFSSWENEVIFGATAVDATEPQFLESTPHTTIFVDETSDVGLLSEQIIHDLGQR